MAHKTIGELERLRPRPNLTEIPAPKVSAVERLPTLNPAHLANPLAEDAHVIACEIVERVLNTKEAKWSLTNGRDGVCPEVAIDFTDLVARYSKKEWGGQACRKAMMAVATGLSVALHPDIKLKEGPVTAEGVKTDEGRAVVKFTFHKLEEVMKAKALALDTKKKGVMQSAICQDCHGVPQLYGGRSM